MSCTDWEERIALHAGGDLPQAEVAEVEAHLAACEGCRAVAAAYGAGIEWLRDAHGEPIATAHCAAVRARVLAELGREKRPAWRRIWVGGLAAAAAAVVLLLWPRAVQTPERIEMAVVRPAVPQMEQPMPVVHASVMNPRRARKAPREAAVSTPEKRPAEPLVVKLLTDDPNVVIYWIAD
jgi:anti-sigma factor RsiW